MKSLLIASLIFSASPFAAEPSATVKLSLATQTYQCTIANQNLNCTPVNQIERKVMDINKNGGKVQIADAAKGLSLDLVTSLNNGNVLYDLTLCSNTACTINDVYSNANGSINQVMLGQYNITETSFFVLGVSLTNASGAVDFSEQINRLKNTIHLAK